MAKTIGDKVSDIAIIGAVIVGGLILYIWNPLGVFDNLFKKDDNEALALAQDAKKKADEAYAEATSVRGTMNGDVPYVSDTSKYQYSNKDLLDTEMWKAGEWGITQIYKNLGLMTPGNVADSVSTGTNSSTTTTQVLNTISSTSSTSSGVGVRTAVGKTANIDYKTTSTFGTGTATPGTVIAKQIVVTSNALKGGKKVY